MPMYILYAYFLLYLIGDDEPFVYDPDAYLALISLVLIDHRIRIVLCDHCHRNEVNIGGDELERSRSSVCHRAVSNENIRSWRRVLLKIVCPITLCFNSRGTTITSVCKPR